MRKLPVKAIQPGELFFLFLPVDQKLPELAKQAEHAHQFILPLLFYVGLFGGIADQAELFSEIAQPFAAEECLQGFRLLVRLFRDSLQPLGQAFFA